MNGFPYIPRLPFYRTDERRAAYLAEVKSWEGTPFRENQSVKGPRGGIDCCHFALAVSKATGAAEPGLKLDVLPVEWVRHWHEHRAESRILDFFRLPGIRERLLRIERDETPEIGDFVAIKQEKSVHHLGLYCGHYVAHVTTGAGVVFTSVRVPEFRKMFAAFYRVYDRQ